MKSQKDWAIEFLDSGAMRFFHMSDRIWGFAEPALREYKSSRLLAEYLHENGFKVDWGISGNANCLYGNLGFWKTSHWLLCRI